MKVLLLIQFLLLFGSSNSQTDSSLLNSFSITEYSLFENTGEIPKSFYKGYKRMVKKSFLITDSVRRFNPTDVVYDGIPSKKLVFGGKDCRYITEEDFETLDEERKCRVNDVLLTVDGGTSIGKAVLFDLEGDYTVDSHVTILRPIGINPLVVVYLLASPIGQLQFNKAESGASGQTAVTEDDIRRFKFPLKDMKYLEKQVSVVDSKRKDIEKEKERLASELNHAWAEFSSSIFTNNEVRKKSSPDIVKQKKVKKNKITFR